MPRVPDHLLESSVYLYGDEARAKTGERLGGSGFLVGVPFNAREPLAAPTLESNLAPPNDSLWNANPHLYVVTNQHVIDDGFCTLRFNAFEGMKMGKVAVRPTERRDWVCHTKSDLAVYPLPFIGSEPYRFAFVPWNLILTETVRRGFDIGIGDDVVSVGRFINFEGRQENEPVARFGNISAMPGTSILEKGYPPQESVLVEARTIPGYSGSPALLSIPHWELQNSDNALRRDLARAAETAGPPPYPARLWLLGIAWGYLYGPNLLIKAGRKKVPGFKVEENNSGMMAAVPAWKLIELLKTKKLVDLREATRSDNPPQGAPG